MTSSIIYYDDKMEQPGQLIILLNKLKPLITGLGEPFTSQKSELLELISKCEIKPVSALKQYHNLLLFLMAYPENETLLKKAQAELNRLKDALDRIGMQGTRREKLSLDGSGFSYTTLTARFSFELVKWLAEQFPNQVEFDSCAVDAYQAEQVMSMLMPVDQHDMIGSFYKADLNKWMKFVTAKSNLSRLLWLIHRIQSVEGNTFTHHSLFALLQVYITITFSGNLHGLTEAYGLKNKPFYHNRLIKEVDPLKIIRAPVNPPEKITLDEKDHLVRTAKMVLCALMRETDPVTYAETQSTLFFKLNRGIAVALYTINSERRLPMECYVGYLAFKNGMPVAYGGGWIYDHRAKIGINIFPAYRGGESAYLFSQLIRLYAQYYNLNCFVAEPYQIGNNNNDGIRSGAFWFYYKLGFRPVQHHLQKLAKEEFHQISTNKNYRTSAVTLRKLAASNMQLIISEDFKSNEYFDLEEIIKLQLKTEARNYGGNKRKADEAAFNHLVKVLEIKNTGKWPVNELAAFKNAAPVIALIPDINTWNKKEKAALIKTIRSKGLLNEKNYIFNFQKHHKLTSSLYALFKKHHKS